MPELLAAVFVASLIGSLHCIGMCGPLMLCATTETPTAGACAPAQLGPGFGNRRRWRAWLSTTGPHAGYHAGRGVGYAALGAAAGAAGALLDLGSALAGLQPIAGLLAGGCLIVVALSAARRGCARNSKASAPSKPSDAPTTPSRAVPQSLSHAWAVVGKAFAWLPTRLMASVVRFPAPMRGLVVGVATALLPCGWLYAFALMAAGTGDPLRGTLVMAAFWAGTLPMLMAFGLGLAPLLRRLGGRLPRLTAWTTAAATLAVGLFMVSGRLSMSPVAMAQGVSVQDSPTSADAPKPCCAAGDAPPSAPPAQSPSPRPAP